MIIVWSCSLGTRTRYIFTGTLIASGGRRRKTNETLHDDRLVLRVFDVTYVEFNGANAWSSTDVELPPFSTSWYVAVPRPDAAYCAEIGYHSYTGRFVTLGRSNVVTTPRMEVSPLTKVRWLTPPERQGTARQSQPLLPSPLSPDDPWNAASAASRSPAPSSDERPSLLGRRVQRLSRSSRE